MAFIGITGMDGFLGVNAVAATTAGLYYSSEYALSYELAYRTGYRDYIRCALGKE